MILIQATFPFRADRMDEALELVDTMVEESGREDGTLEYWAAVDSQLEHTVRFFERYEDEAAFAAHAETEHVTAFTERLPDLLAGEPRVRQFDVDAVSELDL